MQLRKEKTKVYDKKAYPWGGGKLLLPPPHVPVQKSPFPYLGKLQPGIEFKYVCPLPRFCPRALLTRSRRVKISDRDAVPRHLEIWR